MNTSATEPSGFTHLLLSPATVALVQSIGLAGALQHVRVFGNQRGQRVLSSAIHNRENARFVEVQVKDKTALHRTTVLLVEEAWNSVTEDWGGLAKGSIDANFALAEVEARLRHDPTLAELDGMGAKLKVKPVPAQPATAAAPILSTTVPSSVPSAAQQPPKLGSIEAASLEQPISQEANDEHTPRAPHNCDTHGIPAVIFEEDPQHDGTKGTGPKES